MAGQRGTIGELSTFTATVDPRKADVLYWEFFSSQVIVETIKNDLEYFQKESSEFTNMRRQGSFAKDNFFTVYGLSFKLYNKNGEFINYGATSTAQKHLREFINEGVVKLRIETKDYMEFPLSNIFDFPEVAQSGTGATQSTHISFRKQAEIYRLPKPHTIEEEHSFDVSVEGTPGEYNSDVGFIDGQTRLRCTIHGNYQRPVQ